MDKVGPFAVLQLPSEHTAMLRGPKGPAGTVRLQLRLYPFDPTVTWDPPKPIAEARRTTRGTVWVYGTVRHHRPLMIHLL